MKDQNEEKYVCDARVLLVEFYQLVGNEVNKIPMHYDGKKEEVIVFDKNGRPFVKIPKTVLDGVMNTDVEAMPNDNSQKEFDKYARQIKKEYPPTDKK